MSRAVPCAAGKRKCLERVLMRHPLQCTETSGMRLEAVDDGCWTVSPHDLRVLAMIRAHIQDNRRLAETGKERPQKVLFTADRVITIILYSEPPEREVEQQVIYPAVARRSKALGVGAAQ